jgi:hypothetical protein
MDSWDKRYTYAQSLFGIVHHPAPSISSKTASELYQKKCQEFITHTNELMEELKLARWPVAEVERRWKSIEPLIQEADRISLQTSIPAQYSHEEKKTDEPVATPQSFPMSQNTAATSKASNVPFRSHIDQQYEMMEAQDASLGSLSDSVGRLKNLGKAMSEESTLQNRLITEITGQVDEMDKKTLQSTEKAKKL